MCVSLVEELYCKYFEVCLVNPYLKRIYTFYNLGFFSFLIPELILEGRYRTIDLSAFGFERLLRQENMSVPFSLLFISQLRYRDRVEHHTYVSNVNVHAWLFSALNVLFYIFFVVHFKTIQHIRMLHNICAHTWVNGNVYKCFYCMQATKRILIFPRCGLKFSQHRKKSRGTEFFTLGEGFGEKYRVAEGGVWRWTLQSSSIDITIPFAVVGTSSTHPFPRLDIIGKASTCHTEKIKTKRVERKALGEEV
jgi:hypothetical protein